MSNSSIWPTIRTQFNSIWPTDRPLSGATTLGHSRSGSDGNKGVHHIPQSTIRLFWVISRILDGGVLLLCRDAVSVFCSPSRLGHRTLFRGGLPLCRDAVGEFYSPSRLGHCSWGSGWVNTHIHMNPRGPSPFAEFSMITRIFMLEI